MITLLGTPINKQVEYNHEEHRYFLGTKLYRSATQIVEQFIEPFDTKERSEYMTYRYGQTPEYWVKKWYDHNQESLRRGNRKHDYEEQFLYNRGFTSVSEKTFPVFNLKQWYSSTIRYDKLPDGTYPELKLWRHDWKIAGRADKPTLETINRSRYAHIEDYKTNREISMEGFNGRTLKYNLFHLPDCEFTHYSLQLSLYQYMFEYFGFKPGLRRIIHFPHPIEELGTPDPVVYELPYLRNEVILMLSHLKTIGWLS